MSKLDLPLDLVVNNDSTSNRQQTTEISRRGNRGKRKRGDEGSNGQSEQLDNSGWLDKAFQFLYSQILFDYNYACSIPELAGGGDCTHGL